MGEGTMEGKLGVALSGGGSGGGRGIGVLRWSEWSKLRDRLVRPVVLWLGPCD